MNEGSILVAGTLTAGAAASSLDLIRADRVEMAAGIDIDSGRMLTITDNGVPIVMGVSGSTATVTGNGTLGNNLVLGAGATMMPGASAG